MKYVEAHGARIPALGFGTFMLEGSEARRMVERALGTGYRHIDTAQNYGNEAEVGRGITDAAVDRKEVFLTTKVWVANFAGDRLRRSVGESRRRLGTDYIDLLLLHWPNPDVPPAETIETLNEVRAAGKARHIGVSNFTVRLLAEARDLSEAPLVTNQVEYHPFLNQAPVLNAVREAGMTLTAYSPLAQGEVVENETLQEIGRAHGKSAAQVALRWLLQQERVAAIPRSSSPEHAEANFDVWDFELSPDQMREIHMLARPSGRIIDPPGLAPDWDVPA